MVVFNRLALAFLQRSFVMLITKASVSSGCDALRELLLILASDECSFLPFYRSSWFMIEGSEAGVGAGREMLSLMLRRRRPALAKLYKTSAKTPIKASITWHKQHLLCFVGKQVATSTTQGSSFSPDCGNTFLLPDLHPRIMHSCIIRSHMKRAFLDEQ